MLDRDKGAQRSEIETKRSNSRVVRFNSRVNEGRARELIRMSPRPFIFVGTRTRPSRNGARRRRDDVVSIVAPHRG